MSKEQVLRHDTDTLIVKVGSKNVFFDAMVDNAGKSFKISKQELKEMLQ